MLYPTFNQPILILFVALGGLACGLTFDLANFILFPIKKKKWLAQIVYFFASLTSFLCLFFINMAINYGEFRLFTLLEFVFFLLLERFTLGFLWTKALSKCYNWLTKLKGKIKWKKKIKENG